ncbi:MAG: TIGR01777 family oxidoreductase [Nitrospira sp.]
MRIVVTGATGFIGRALCTTLHQTGHHVVVLSRRPDEAQRLFVGGITVTPWDNRESGLWERQLHGADAIVNFAGAPIVGARWSAQRKQVLLDSRVLTTRRLVRALSRCATKPPTLISTSGIGYYGASDDHLLDEHSARGQGFLADLCEEWEAEAQRASEFGVRVVVLRTGMVLDGDGGALPKMALPFRFLLGGPVMPGTQWVSWIHRRDHIDLIRWILVNPGISGPVNAVAPGAVTMRDFCAALGRVLHRPSWLPVPKAVLELGLGELGTIMTTGQRVQPAAALKAGYRFQYPELETALSTIYSKL